MKRDNKIKVCRILAVVFLCFWTISGVRVLAQNATSILDKAASAYEDSNGLTAYFTMQTRSDVQKVSESFDGTVDIKGDKFVLKTPDMITWFDGTTQWSFVERNEEVNVSTPRSCRLRIRPCCSVPMKKDLPLNIRARARLRAAKLLMISSWFLKRKAISYGWSSR